MYRRLSSLLCRRLHSYGLEAPKDSPSRNSHRPQKDSPCKTSRICTEYEPACRTNRLGVGNCGCQYWKPKTTLQNDEAASLPIPYPAALWDEHQNRARNNSRRVFL